MMKIINILILIAALALAGCRTTRQMYRASVEKEAANLAELFDAVQRAEGARLHIMENGPKMEEREVTYSKKEFDRLKGILLRTQVIPPPHNPERLFMTVSVSAFVDLELLDEEGKIIRKLPMNFEWISESDLKSYPPERQRFIYDPNWCLPDADYAELNTLLSKRGTRRHAKR